MKDAGETPRAIELYERALALACQIGDRNTEKVLLSNLGNAYAAQRQADRAIDCYEQALTVAQQIGDAGVEGITLDNLGNAYASQAGSRFIRLLLFMKRALTLVNREEVVQTDPSRAAIIYRNRGNAYIALEEFQKAIADYNMAIALDPGDAAAYTSKADALAQLKRYEKAFAWYDRAIALESEEATIYRSRGDILVQMWHH